MTHVPASSHGTSLPDPASQPDLSRLIVASGAPAWTPASVEVLTIGPTICNNNDYIPITWVYSTLDHMLDLTVPTAPVVPAKGIYSAFVTLHATERIGFTAYAEIAVGENVNNLFQDVTWITTKGAEGFSPAAALACGGPVAAGDSLQIFVSQNSGLTMTFTGYAVVYRGA